MTHPFRCPVCSLPLKEEPKRYVCEKNHSFDKAAKGYVNLHLRPSAAENHGDDRPMIDARTAFLSSGAYSCLSDALTAISLPLLPHGGLFIDAGCGEGHYAALLSDALRHADKSATLMGIDLSKIALAAAARRKAGLKLAVASVFHLPVADGSADLIWDIFAPAAEEEYLRVLKPGGHLVRAYALEEHLMGLKEILYDEVYRNPAEGPAFPGMTLIAERQVRETLTLSDPVLIDALFRMTPYYYNTPASGHRRLKAVKALTTPIAFGIAVYQKQ